MKRNRPDLAAFTPGALYIHSATGEIVEFIGVAHAARDEDSEDVGWFRFVNQDTPPLAANRAGYDAGETFEPVRAVEPETLEVGPMTARQYLAGKVDREDIFGVRRALDGLAERLWDRFLQCWAELGAACEYDLNLLRVEVLREASASRDVEPRLADAWSTIAAAMSSYIAWRAGRRRFVTPALVEPTTTRVAHRSPRRVQGFRTDRPSTPRSHIEPAHASSDGDT